VYHLLVLPDCLTDSLSLTHSHTDPVWAAALLEGIVEDENDCDYVGAAFGHMDPNCKFVGLPFSLTALFEKLTI
jgi:hypothetical protein